jgi:hypothetical protein
MKECGRWFVPAVLILLTVACIFSCGSGGDGDSDPQGPPPGPSYTIDAETIDDLLQRVNDMGIGCTIDGSGSRFSTTLDTLEALLPETVDKVSGAYRALKTNGISAAAVDLDPIIVGSTCPGSTGQMRIDVSHDDETDAYNGTLVFTDFCFSGEEIGEITVAGGATFSGELDFDSEGKLNSMNLTAGTTSPIIVTSTDLRAGVGFTGLSISMGEGSGGGMTLGVCWAGLDIDIQKGDDSESIDTNNVCINVSAPGAGGVTVTGSGRITTDDGSLDVSTPTPFTVDSGGNISGGVLQIDGADNTGVQIIAGTGCAFSVLADLDGDGEYDDYSQEMDCAELCSDIRDMFEM